MGPLVSEDQRQTPFTVSEVQIQFVYFVFLLSPSCFVCKAEFQFDLLNQRCIDITLLIQMDVNILTFNSIDGYFK